MIVRILILLASLACTSPASAALAGADDIASGQVSGTYTYRAPGLGGLCTTDADSEIDVRSEDLSVGTFHATGGGQSTGCETAMLGGGTMGLFATFVPPSGQAHTCDDLRGRYTRAGSSVHIIVMGSCDVGPYGSGLFTVEIKGTRIPATSHGWFAGWYVVAPASSAP